ncbi:MAG: hypothetical protein KIT02_08205 [Devosia sp.]|uniref:hypothetical protein n=1 Tax=Devosia sp. TaxID=1871048 RepID=UPI0024CAFB24|nr:hypothetical protein [Devosia sp.]UYO01168.1 MAG: hypothetical protein KIT02_08205 [Devosia sp.]
MRLVLLLTITSLVAGPVLASECTLYNARYKQPGAPWWITFTQVPQVSAPNQTAAFYFEMPNSDVTMQGAVHVPNGFGSPLWSVTGPCTAGGTEECGFLEEYQHPAVYGVYDGEVRFLDIERGSAAPDQIILPQLAVSLWYSNYRQSEWVDDLEPGDAFKLVGCE